MSPIVIAVAGWLAVNVITVLLVLRLAAARERAFRARAGEMVRAAERHANSATVAREPVTARRR